MCFTIEVISQFNAYTCTVYFIKQTRHISIDPHLIISWVKGIWIFVETASSTHLSVWKDTEEGLVCSHNWKDAFVINGRLTIDIMNYANLAKASSPDRWFWGYVRVSFLAKPISLSMVIDEYQVHKNLIFLCNRMCLINATLGVPQNIKSAAIISNARCCRRATV